MLRVLGLLPPPSPTHTASLYPYLPSDLQNYTLSWFLLVCLQCNLSYQTDLHFFWNLANAIDSDVKIHTYRHAYLDFPLGVWLAHLCIISVCLLLCTVTCDTHIDLADYLISGGPLACTTTPSLFVTSFLEHTHVYRNTGMHPLHLYHHPLPTTPHPWRFTL